MTRLLISIVTPCMNRVDLVREAIESVLVQNYPDFEHIITDGGSTDGTLDVLRAYPHLRVVSEPDKGIFDAINKGIRMAQGDIIGLLNTDDLYAEDCFSTVVRAFEQNPEAQAVVGGVTIFSDEGGRRRTVDASPAIEPDELWFRLIQGNPATNGWFFRRAVFERVGHFDARYRYSSDRYFLIHVALDGGICPVPIRQVLYHYRQHSGSGTMTSLDSRSPQYGPLRMKILEEDITFQEDFLNRPVLPEEVRRRMRRDHGERCYRLAATAAFHRQFRLAGEAVRRGFRQNALWPFIFAEMAVRRLRKEIVGHE